MGLRIVKSAAALALVLGVVLSPVRASAATIGFILAEEGPFASSVVAEVKKELKAASVSADYIEQRPAPDTASWSNAARKLAAYDAALVIVVGAPVSIASLHDDIEAPILFAAARTDVSKVSGSRSTGVVWNISLAGVLRYLKTINEFSTLAVAAPSARDHASADGELKRLAPKMSFSPKNIVVSNGSPNFDGTDAVFALAACGWSKCLDRVVKSARGKHLATASDYAGAVDRGVLLGVEADPKALGKEVSRIAVRLLKGDAPSSIPMATVNKSLLALNLREAQNAGVKIPVDLLSVARRVIK